MPKARRTSYNLTFKLKIVAEAEAVENNSEIAREYGISESMVRRWRKDQANLFNGEIKLSAKRKTMGCFMPKYPELNQRILEWFTKQRSQGKFSVEQQKHDPKINQSADRRVNVSWMCDSQNYRSIMWQHIVYERFSFTSFHKRQDKFITSSNFYPSDRLVTFSLRFA